MKALKAEPVPGNMTPFNYSNMQASEETLNVVVTALLTINHEQFDFGSMLGFLTSAVGNESQRTGTVALEAIAVVNKLTGPRFSSLLSSCNVSERVQSKIIERVQNDNLPIIASDGTVQYPWSGKSRSRILNNENKNMVAMLRKNASPKDVKSEYLNGNKPLLRRKENLGIEVPYSDQRITEARRGLANGSDFDQVLSTRSDVLPLSSNEMDVISKYDQVGAYPGARDHDTSFAHPSYSSSKLAVDTSNGDSDYHSVTNGNGDYGRIGGVQQNRKVNGESNGVGVSKYVPQVRRSITFADPEDNGTAMAHAPSAKAEVIVHNGSRMDLPRGGYKADAPSAMVSSSDGDKRTQQKRFIRPIRAPQSKTAESSSGDGNGEGPTNGSSRPGSNGGWRNTGRSMVVDKLAILKKRQESRRANSANAVLQRAKSDPTLGYYMNEPLQISNRSIFSSNSLCPPPNRYSTPRMARTARARAQGALQAQITVTDSSNSSSTFASGGIGTPKTFRNHRSIFNNGGGGADHRSPVCRLVSSKYERNGLDESGKPLEFTTSELQPCLDPDGTMKDVLSSLAIANSANRKDLNWIAQYEALTNARRLIVNHSSTVLPQLHSLILAVKPALIELRSYTVKNAMMLIREMFATLKSHVDPELEHVVPLLLKKAGESSTAGRIKATFLSQEADSVLTNMVQNCNEAKCAQALLACSKHKAGTVRTKVIMHLYQVVAKSSRRVLQNRDLLDRIMSCAASYLDEPSNISRGYSKHLLWTLGETAPYEIRNFLNKVSDIKAKQIRNAVSNPPPPMPSTTSGAVGTQKRSGMGQYAAEGKGFQSLAVDGTQRPRAPSSRSRRRDAATSSPKAEETLADTLDKIKNSKDWRERFQCLQALEKDLLRLGEIQETKLISAFDALIPRVADGNSKVAVQALQTIADVITASKNTSVVVLNNLMPTLASTIGSSNEKIRKKASKTLHTLCAEVDSVYLIQNLSHCIKHSGPRSQPVLIEQLSTLIPQTYQRKPQLVTKYVFPVAFSMVNDKSTGIRVTVQKLVVSLHKAMGPALLDFVDHHLGQGLQAKVHEMLTHGYV